MKDAKKNGENLRKELGKKNVKKCEWLVKKYGVKNMEYEELTNDEVRKYVKAEIFKVVTEMRGEELRAPEIVRGDNEVINLTNEEIIVLVLGPKFCVRKEKLSEEEFEVELEECIVKIKWDKRGEYEESKKGKTPADIAIMSILDDEEKDDVEGYEEMREAMEDCV